MDKKRVEILDRIYDKKGSYLDRFYDPIADKYFAPVLPSSGPFFEWVRKMHKEGITGAGVKAAIIDTGMMLNHPRIKRNLEESVDFTGEGFEDLNGHGTMVTLIMLLTAPSARLLNVKTMDAKGRGTEEDLIKGIQWSVKKGAEVINISGGVYHKKWGLLECRGNCKICQAAESAAKSGVLVVAAAGNEPGKTYCPAKLGIINEDIGVLSVGGYDYETGKICSYSGVGNLYYPVGKHRFIPLE